MKLTSTEVINRPLDEVYALVRDNLDKLVPHMPNVGRIEVKSKKTTGDKTEMVNHWYAKAEIPSLLKKFLNPDIFSWKDVAVWDDKAHKVDYRLESFVANDLFDAHGTNSFKAIGADKTELTISCDVTIHADKVPGVPRLLARQVTPAIESLLEKILGPNMTALGKGLNQYYAGK
jgi:hypothetical protein